MYLLQIAISNNGRLADRERGKRMTVDEFVESMQVKVNILNEQKAERERYERGVIAMREASNKESM